METPLDRNGTTRVRIAFFFLVVFIVSMSVGAYFMADLRKLQESVAVRESQTLLQGVADSNQFDQALRKRPANKILQTIAAAAKAAGETGIAADTMSAEVEPTSIAKSPDLRTASRTDLEALERDLKTAEANANAFVPRYVALLKTERNAVENFARSQHMEKDTVAKLLERLDNRHARMIALTSELTGARAEYYRAYATYVGILVREFSAYKVVNGQFIFPFQRTVDRYNLAAHAMGSAAKRVAELEEERKIIASSQAEVWEQFVDRK